jgi:hypothetical protein
MCCSTRTYYPDIERVDVLLHSDMLSWYWACRCVAPLRHIILILSVYMCCSTQTYYPDIEHVDVLLHSNILSWYWVDQSLFLLINAACLRGEATNTYFILCSLWIDPTSVWTQHLRTPLRKTVWTQHLRTPLRKTVWTQHLRTPLRKTVWT